MESQKKCLNCDEVTTQNYCSNCGQRCNVPKITFKEIFADFLNSVFNLDSPFLKTITQLFTKPKEVVIDYINGKRKTYYSPIRYLVVCLFINLWWSTYDNIQVPTAKKIPIIQTEISMRLFAHGFTTYSV